DYSLSRETSRTTLRSTTVPIDRRGEQCFLHINGYSKLPRIILTHSQIIHNPGTRPVMSHSGYNIPITSSPDHSTLPSPTASQICLPSPEVRPLDNQSASYSNPVSPTSGAFIYRTDTMNTNSSYNTQ